MEKKRLKEQKNEPPLLRQSSQSQNVMLHGQLHARDPGLPKKDRALSNQSLIQVTGAAYGREPDDESASKSRASNLSERKQLDGDPRGEGHHVDRGKHGTAFHTATVDDLLANITNFNDKELFRSFQAGPDPGDRLELLKDIRVLDPKSKERQLQEIQDQKFREGLDRINRAEISASDSEDGKELKLKQSSLLSKAGASMVLGSGAASDQQMLDLVDQ